MVTLGRMTLANPIVAASGALGFGRGYWWDRPLIYAGIIEPDSVGAVITKTLTSMRRVGNWKGWNPWQVLWPLRGGWVNAFGLTNGGLDWFIMNEYAQTHHDNLIVSITDPDPANIISMVRRLDRLDILAIEINLSCPNTPEWVCLQCEANITRELFSRARQETRHPLIAKIGYLPATQRERIAEALDTADAVDMINTIPYGNRFPGKMSPLKKGGGVSGPLVRQHALEQVGWFARNTHLPIIGGGGVCSADDAQNFINAGASAVSVGSAHIMRPWVSTHLATHYTWAH